MAVLEMIIENDIQVWLALTIGVLLIWQENWKKENME